MKKNYEFLSPENKRNFTELSSDEQMIKLINKLSTIIKNFYKNTKIAISSTNQNIKYNNHINNNELTHKNYQDEPHIIINSYNMVDIIDFSLNSFLIEAKQIFQQLKLVRRKNFIKREINSPLLRDCINSQQSSQYHSNLESPGKNDQIVNEKIKCSNQNSQNEDNNNNQINNFNHDNNIPFCLSQKSLQLAKEIINFLKIIPSFKDCIYNKKFNPNEKIFDTLKNDLYKLIMNILNNNNNIISDKNFVSIEEEKNQINNLNAKLKSKNTANKKENTHKLENELHVKDFQIQKLSNEIINKNQTMCKRDTSLSKLKTENQNLKREIKEKEKSFEAKFKEEKMQNKNIADNNKLMTKIKEKDLKIKRLEISIDEMTNIIQMMNKEKEKEINKLKLESQNLLNNINKLNNENHLIEKNYNTKIIQIIEQNKKSIESLNIQLQKKQNEYEKLSNEINEHISQFKNNVIEEKIKDDNKLKEIWGNNTNIEEYKEKCLKYQITIIEKEKELNGIKSENKKLSKEIEELNNYKQTKEKEQKFQNQREIKKVKSYSEKDFKDYLNLKDSEIKTKDEIIKELNNKNAGLQENIIYYKEKNAKMEKNINKITEMLKEKEELIQKLANNIETYEIKAKNYDEEILNDKHNINTLRERIKILEKTIEENNTKIFLRKQNEEEQKKINKEIQKEKILSQKYNALEMNKLSSNYPNKEQDKISIVEEENKSLLNQLKEVNRELNNNQKVKISNENHLLKSSKKFSYTPEAYSIISDKCFLKLRWFLLTLKNNNINLLNYEQCIWLAEKDLPYDLSKYNQFKSEKNNESESLLTLVKEQEKFIKQLEEKDDEINQLKNKINQENSKSKNLTGSFNKSFKNNIGFNSISKDFDFNQSNVNNSIPLDKFEKVINELNNAHFTLAQTKYYIEKLTQENKELKGIDEKQCFSFVDEELKDVIELPGSKSIYSKEPISFDFDQKFDQLKNLIQLLIHEMNINEKTKSLLVDICSIVGYKKEEIENLLNNKGKKGKLKNFFQKNK